MTIRTSGAIWRNVVLSVVLVLAGGLCQLAGVLVTLAGARSTWNTYRADEPLSAPLWRRPADLALRLADRLQRMVGRPPRQRVHSVGAAGEVSVVGRAVGTKQFHPLPHEQSHDEALYELDERTRELMDRLNQFTLRSRDESAETSDKVEALQRDVLSHGAALQKNTREVATDGIRTIYLGLWLTAAGVVVQTVGSVLP